MAVSSGDAAFKGDSGNKDVALRFPRSTVVNANQTWKTPLSEGSRKFRKLHGGHRASRKKKDNEPSSGKESEERHEHASSSSSMASSNSVELRQIASELREILIELRNTVREEHDRFVAVWGNLL